MKKKNSVQFKNGSYSAVITLIAIAIFVLVNLFVNKLPETVTNISTSDVNYYALTDVTKNYLKNSLNTDINLYLLSDSMGGYDDYVEKLCSNYDHESGKVHFKKVDVAVNPTFANKYDAMTASEYSVIVENASNAAYELIDYDDIKYQTERTDELRQKYLEYSYDGEGLITSAVASVTSGKKIKIYQITGHGETNVNSNNLSETYNALIKSNYILSDELINLKSSGNVPVDCDILFIYFPRSDYSDAEVAALKAYAENGGNFIIIHNNMASFSGNSYVEYSNFNSFLAYLGVSIENGYIRESQKSSGHYLAIDSSINADSQAFLLPRANGATSITSTIKGNNIAPYASPIRALESSDAVITELLKTSANYSVYYFEDNKDPYEVNYNSAATIAAFIEKNNSKALIVACTTFIRSGESSNGNIYDNTVLDNNIQLLVNAANSMNENVSQVYVAPKLMEEKFNSVNNKNKNVYSLIYIGLIPALVLLCGFAVWFIRRSK